MIQKKYKLSDIAKDLNVPQNDVMEIIAPHNEAPKKATAPLTDFELSLVFDKLTKKNQVESFDDYFAVLDKKPAKVEKPIAKAVEKPAEKPAVKVVEKAAEKAQKPELSAEIPTAPVAPTAIPSAPIAAAAPTTPAATAAGGTTKAATATATATAQPVHNAPYPFKSAPQRNSQNRPQSNQQGRTPNTNISAGQTAQQSAQKQTPMVFEKRPVNPITPNKTKAASQNPDFYSNNNARAPKAVIKPAPTRPGQNQGFRPTTPVQGRVETSSQAESTVRHVDTRTVDVNLDKYNERYEQIAPGQANPRNDSFQKRQKLNQKSQQRAKQKYSNKKETEAQKLQRLALERARKQQLKVMIPEEIIVSELASRLKVTVSDVIKRLMVLGVMASQTELVDFDTASLVAEELGARVEKEVVISVEERLIDDSTDEDENLENRSPVVVVMGHVDHGKTSLLDKIRHADVTSTEAGGITQHIGAYTVAVKDKTVTFLDTPGHEAFTSMRARGASITDIAILVVAADDGIMPQTVEAINHAKAAGVSIIVAINKMDKPHANPDKVMQELTEYELVPEAWGGDVICCPVSALTGEGIDQLLDYVTLVADLADLKANPNRLAKGAVIEARLDKGRGPVATLLVQNGTLKTGDIIIAGASVGRVRVMTNDKGVEVETAGPSTPVEITGLAEVPAAGDVFNAVEDERLARTLVDQRKYDQKEEVFRQYQKVTLDNLFSQIAEGAVKELPIIVKADVQGSAEAVKQSLEKLSNEEVRVRVIHCGVGAVSKSDTMLAQVSGAIIIGFNVRPDQNVRDSSDSEDTEIRLYRIIYDAIEDVKQAMKGMLDPKTREVELGRAEVRQVYKITNVGVVAGCYVIDGKVARHALIRVVRDGIVLAEDKIDSLKRFKDDQREVATGYECGIGLDKFNDIKEGDILESFIIEEYRD